MEFKDRLKALRQENKISQQALANAIYVSRSAIAKWENGLGLPSQASHRALLDYFKITEEELPLNEEIDIASVSKNKKIRVLSSTVAILLSLIFIIVSLSFVHLVKNGYGFTSEMAAGKIWADEEYIITPEYHFYYDYIGGECKIIDTFSAVEKKLIGYQKLDVSKYKKTIFDESGKVFGYLYSFKGEFRYYNFYISVKALYEPDALVRVNLLSELKIKEERFFTLHNSYFETNFEVSSFYVDNKLYTVK